LHSFLTSGPKNRPVSHSEWSEQGGSKISYTPYIVSKFYLSL
jgi:hypothetical protein